MMGGRVRLNGNEVVLGDRVDPESDVLTVDGAPIPISEELETHLLYKPMGVISTADDPQGRRTVIDLIPSSKRLYPVGRLDADSEGLILVSNDGELTHRVTHPSFGITKTYLAEVHGVPGRTALRRLVSGVDLEDGPARAITVNLVDSQERRALVELTMLEGRNREVRRMFDVIGHEVIRLVRTAIGGLVDTSLRPGESRRVSVAEIHDLLET